MFSYWLDDQAELRPLEPWNAAELLRCVDSARERLAAWTHLAHRVVDLPSARRLLQDYADRQAHDTGRYLGIWEGGELVGGALFRSFDARLGVCEVGVWVVPSARGRGLATRALWTMTDWALRTRGLYRVEMRTSPANAETRAIAERLGMRREGTLRQAFAVGGVRHDSEVWAVLRDEWLGGRPAPGGTFAARRG
ncbi:GNAT family N-acetyltransferase [Nocardiopsis lucentensis]|uniref:GNAT family N-acetyltransferase n=1 Tax=Nocardiopsis lucentensis TaxID=53441 RepID=UPI000347A3EE|nr:GNAT family protein [Nocardiopsis lucentensis]